jgi:Transglutaminase-like superfamily
MNYNWEGDAILQDTAIDKKRYVIGRKEPLTTDIREWMSFRDNIIIRDILAELTGKRGLPTTKKPGEFDKRAMVVWRFVTDSIAYMHDTTQYKKDDFWLFPPETYQIGKGDCEDSSFLLATLLLSCGISPFCVRVVMGMAYEGTGKPLGGHCWPIYKTEAGRWCILESTLDKIPARMPDADELAGEGQPFRYEPLYCFNDHHLWEIFSQSAAKTGGGNLKKYFKARTKKVDMRTVLQGGGKH